MRLFFEKYEGLGNDFLVVDERGLTLDDAVIRHLCDRHRGIGADGVLVVSASLQPELAGMMVVRNADGSRPEMCGNGLRCAALCLARRQGREHALMQVETDAGPRRCEVSGENVTVDMGAVRGETKLSTLDLPDERLNVWNLNMGNPHTVVFVPDETHACERWGQQVATHPSFERGTNAGFAHVIDATTLALRVWERGVGPTLACGTGACAAAAASCLGGTSPFGTPIHVGLPGGTLHVTVNADLDVAMTGPARHVFSGEVVV